MIHLLLPKYLSTIVLYTISDLETSKIIVEALTKANFTQEGDQSTLMKTTEFKRTDAVKFQECINKAGKHLKFSTNDTFTLLIPDYKTESVKREGNEVESIKYPVIARYRFRYNEKSKSFILSTNE